MNFQLTELNFKSLLSIILLWTILVIAEISSVSGSSKYLLNKPNCTKENLAKMEINVAKLMPIGHYARKLPETLNDTQKYCK